MSRKIIHLLCFSALLILAGCDSGGGSNSALPSSSDSQTSQPPTNTLVSADAGKNVTVNKFSKVVLDGVGSSNGKAYSWTQLEGPTVNLVGTDTVSPSFTATSTGSYKFNLAVSNATSSESAQVLVTVQDISTVSISLPSSGNSISVNQKDLVVAGYAGSNMATVTLRNKATNTVHVGVLDGQGNFRIESIFLNTGDNALEVTGTDNTGAETKDSLLVVYTPSVNFLSLPAFSVESGIINESIETIVSIAIQDNDNILTDGVELVEGITGSSDAPPQVITILRDNGNVDSGDDIAGDGVFSGKVTIEKASAGISNYRVSVNTGSIEYSPPLSFYVLNPFSDLVIEQTEKLAVDTISEYFPAEGTTFNTVDFDNYKNNMLAEFLNLEEVVSARLSSDGNSISIEFISGLFHTIDFVYQDTKSGVASKYDLPNKPALSQPVPIYQKVRKKVPEQSNALFSVTSSVVETSDQVDSVNSIGSYRTLALSPFKWQFGSLDDVEGAYEKLQNSEGPAFLATAPLLDYDVTVEHFKNLSQYGVVVISSHGGLEGSDPVIYTGEEATPEKQKIYQNDIMAKRLMISHRISIIVKEGGFLFFDSLEKEKVFKIAPSFITKYNHDLPNTLVYMSICSGLETDSLANAFLAAGAGGFIGYTDTVWSGYAYQSGNILFEEMIKGKTLEDAVSKAKSQLGVNDTVWKQNNGGKDDGSPAAMVFRGNGDLILERTGLQNGGFEDNLKFWDRNGGDIRILSRLSSLTPQESDYFGILSSGLGSVSDSEAIISQQFKVPEDVNSLKLSYNVVSEEPLEFVNTQYDDKFRTVLIDQEGNESVLAYETVNGSTWTGITGSQSDGGMFDGGDHTAFHTGWKHITHDISSLRGQTVSLKFRVWDVGDSVYDTAALLDNIHLQ